jgi:hypothetical protein
MLTAVRDSVMPMPLMMDSWVKYFATTSHW